MGVEKLRGRLFAAKLAQSLRDSRHDGTAGLGAGRDYAGCDLAPRAASVAATA
jgi:hypothetical protein